MDYHFLLQGQKFEGDIFYLLLENLKKKKNHDLDHLIISKTNLEKNNARDAIFIFHKNNHDRPMYYSSSFNFNILLRNSR